MKNPNYTQNPSSGYYRRKLLNLESAVSNLFSTVRILAHFAVSIAGLLAGAVAGAIGGLFLGWLLAFGYHRRGPSDPADAPVYVAMGLIFLGACVGAVAGFIIGIIYSVRLAKTQRLYVGPTSLNR